MKKYKRDAVMAIHMDAGNRDGKKRELFVLLDSGANAVDVVEGDAEALVKAGYVEIPTFGPLDVKSGTYREMLQLKRQGNPQVQHRKAGRWQRRDNRPLQASIGERAPNVSAMKQRLMPRRRRK